jgi:hypothetical protein
MSFDFGFWVSSLQRGERISLWGDCHIVCVAIRSYAVLKLFNENKFFLTKQGHLCSIMSETTY